MITRSAFLLVPVALTLQTESLPPTNQAILAYVQEHMGEKVGRGECWDLAAGALDAAHANWDGAYGFGEPMDWRKDTIVPGDIVQFEGVTIHHREGARTESLSMGHHTAIVMQVSERGSFRIAHQNFGKVGRKVSQLDFDIADMRGGKVVFYRPVP